MRSIGKVDSLSLTSPVQSQAALLLVVPLEVEVVEVLVAACLGCKYEFPADHRPSGVAEPKEGKSVSAAEAATSPRSMAAK